MHLIYLIHEFHNLSWITEINELFHNILIYWDAPVYIFTFMRLADAFIQSDLKCIQAIHLYCQYVCSLGIKPTTFALLTQCSTTEPQEHTYAEATEVFSCWQDNISHQALSVLYNTFDFQSWDCQAWWDI